MKRWRSTHLDAFAAVAPVPPSVAAVGPAVGSLRCVVVKRWPSTHVHAFTAVAPVPPSVVAVGPAVGSLRCVSSPWRLVARGMQHAHYCISDNFG